MPKRLAVEYEKSLRPKSNDLARVTLDERMADNKSPVRGRDIPADPPVLTPQKLAEHHTPEKLIPPAQLPEVEERVPCMYS